MYEHKEDKMKREDRRPLIRGLDDIECSNYLRGLFKYEGLSHYVCNAIKHNTDKSDYFPDQVLPDVTPEQVDRVIGIIEDKLREDLCEYSNQLDESIEFVNKYIDGLLDAHGVPAYEEE